MTNIILYNETEWDHKAASIDWFNNMTNYGDAIVDTVRVTDNQFLVNI